MRCQLFDAAGNKILWLDAGDFTAETGYSQLRIAGSRLARRYRIGQEMTAVLFRCGERCYRALFWNPDGTYEMLCGNAIRCLAHFLSSAAFPLNRVCVSTEFGDCVSRKCNGSVGSVEMPREAVQVAATDGGDLLVNAGTPHRIRLVNREWPDQDVRDAIFHSAHGDRVNFNLLHEIGPYLYRVRIFERGVGETFSCGTAAAAIAAAIDNHTNGSTPPLTRHLVQFASGEQLTVTHDRSGDSYEVSGNVNLLETISS
jgi:diaminopimelate epimerase